MMSNEVLKNTGSMCLVRIQDERAFGGIRMVDLGNYYKTPEGERVLVTSKTNASLYGHLVDCKILSVD